MKHFISLSVGVVSLIALVVMLFVAQPTKASSTDNISGWAWSSTIGWISMNCTTGGEGSTDICASSNYGVTMNETTGVLSGYAWSPNVGWISFNASDLSSGTGSGTSESSAFIPKAHAQTTCTAATVFNPSSVADRAVTGCIKVLNAASGWDGIIRLSGSGYGSPVASGLGGVTLKANDAFVGYAWGDTVMGWINFNGVFLGEAQLRFIVNDGTTDNTESFTTTLGAGGDKDLTVKWEANGATECIPESRPSISVWTPSVTISTVNLTGLPVSIVETTDFTITCTYGATEVSKTITASIGGPTLSLSASPTTIARDSHEYTALTMSTPNAGFGGIPDFTSCELEINWGTKGDTTETKAVECPRYMNDLTIEEYVPGGDTGTTTKYTLRGQYSGGTATAIAYVTVITDASVTLDVSTAPTMSPGTLGLTWTLVNISSCNKSWSLKGTEASDTENNVSFFNPTTYTLNCVSIYGDTVIKSRTVSLPGPGQKPRYQEL